MEDDKIIALFFARSEDAIHALAEKYGRLCTKVATNILNNGQDAEECVNDTYLGVWNTVPPQKPNPLVRYVCRIVRNLSIAKYHANTAAKRNSSYDVALDELENCFASADCVEDAFDAQQTAESISKFLMTLEQESRVMFVRRYYYAEPIGEIAKLFGKSNHYISVKLSRIREKLKSHLKKEGVAL